MNKIMMIMMVALMLSFTVKATDGAFAINDVCDGLGCFNGDNGGFPVTITESGSYQLTSNLVSTSTTINVIEINADNVTLDLNGFSIIGPRTCTGANSTLSCTNSGMTANGINGNDRDNVIVKNGIVKGFDTGVRLSGINQRGNRVTGIHASENEFGIVLINGIIKDSVANLNLDSGYSNGVFGTLMVMDSFAWGNRARSAFAFVCSNVIFGNNGSDASCQRYTNESSCGTGLDVCP